MDAMPIVLKSQRLSSPDRRRCSTSTGKPHCLKTMKIASARGAHVAYTSRTRRRYEGSAFSTSVRSSVRI
jgi:hypothetical protein